LLNNPAARKVTTAVLEPTARGLLAMHVSADVVTVFATIGVVITALVAFPNGHFVVGVVIIAVLALGDLLDGTMARIAGTCGPWGNFLDASMDRIADGAILSGVVLWAVNGRQTGLAAAGLLVLVMSQVTSYTKARAEAVGATANVGIAERAERLIVVLVALFITGFGVPFILPVALWTLGALGVVTVVQRIITVRRQLKR